MQVHCDLVTGLHHVPVPTRAMLHHAWWRSFHSPLLHVPDFILHVNTDDTMGINELKARHCAGNRNYFSVVVCYCTVVCKQRSRCKQKTNAQGGNDVEQFGFHGTPQKLILKISPLDYRK